MEYPYHDNAADILRRYQICKWASGRPHANIAGDKAVRLFHLWRSAWMEECLRQMQPNDKRDSGALLSAYTMSKGHDTQTTFSGF